MAESDVAKQLKNFVSSLKNQGTLDENYDTLTNLKDEQNPEFHLEIIATFFQETEITIAEIHRYLKKHAIEYSKVESCAHKLKGSSASVGGSKMASACRELRQASEDHNMERSIEAFSKMRGEYQVLREGLSRISQMERRIMAMERRGRA